MQIIYAVGFILRLFCKPDTFLKGQLSSGHQVLDMQKCCIMSVDPPKADNTITGADVVIMYCTKLHNEKKL